MTPITWSDIAEKITETLVGVLAYIPNVVASILILLIGVLVGWAFKTIIMRALQAIKVKPHLDRLGLAKVYPSKFDLIEFIGDVTKWVVIIVFLIPALEVLLPREQAGQTVDIIRSVVEFIPSVIAAAAIFFVGLVVADLISRAIEGASEAIGAKQSKFLADFARWAIVIFVVLLALAQLQIRQIDTIIQAISFGIGGAFALAFGFGGQDYAKDILSRFRKNLPK